MTDSMATSADPCPVSKTGGRMSSVGDVLPRRHVISRATCNSNTCMVRQARAIGDLSPEILSEIFMHVVSATLSFTDRDAYLYNAQAESACYETWLDNLPTPRKIFNLVKVCQSWRGTVESTPQLWRALHIIPRDKPNALSMVQDIVPLWIQRAKSLTRELSLSLTEIKEIQSSLIINAVTNVATRVGALDIRIRSPDCLQQACTCGPGSPGNLPLWTKLKYLYLQSDELDGSDDNAGRICLFRNTPELEIATLRTYGTTVDSATLPWSQLRKLTLLTETHSIVILQILRLCSTRLEDLDLQLLSGEISRLSPDEAEMVHLEHLRSFRIRGWHGAVNVMGSVFVPNITLLETGGIFLKDNPKDHYLPPLMIEFGEIESYRIEHVKTFLDRHSDWLSKNVTVLRFINQEFFICPLLECLRLLPEVKELTIYSEHPEHRVNSELLKQFSAEFEEPILPKLEVLNLEIHFSQDSFAICDLARIIHYRLIDSHFEDVTVGSRNPDTDDEAHMDVDQVEDWIASEPEDGNYDENDSVVQALSDEGVAVSGTSVGQGEDEVDKCDGQDDEDRVAIDEETESLMGVGEIRKVRVLHGGFIKCTTESVHKLVHEYQDAGLLELKLVA